jgi:hypothetical protein
VRPKIKGVRELQFEGFILHAPDTHGEVSTQEWQSTFRADFQNGAYSDDDIVDVFTQRITTLLHIYKNVFIPNGAYNFTRHQLTYGSGQDRRFTYNFFERFGGYYAGTLNEFRVQANYRATENFSISASETWDRFRLPLLNGHDLSENCCDAGGDRGAAEFGSAEIRCSSFDGIFVETKSTDQRKY